MYLTDMIRAEISCENEEEVKEVYELMKQLPKHMCKILRLKPKLTTQLMNVTINLDFNGVMICEIQVKLVKKSPLSEDHHFVYEMARAGRSQNMFTIMDAFNVRIKYLVENGFLKSSMGSKQ